MNPITILKFLVPQDLFQLIFLAIIVGLAGSNIFGVKIGWGKVKDQDEPQAVGVWRGANEEYWKSSWYNHTKKIAADDLDAEHGTLNDLSQAVASTPEKIAEIMPGILLVFGLLGTFLGLGIALDRASEILQTPQVPGMDEKMSQLIGMMEGIGTKFKTSTWGIIGFLLFKAWVTWDGFDERRMRWCVIKMKEQFSSRRKQLKKESDDRSTKITNEIKQMSTAVKSFIDTNEKNITSMSKASKEMAMAGKEMGAAIGGFEKQTTRVLSNLETNLSKTITIMSGNIQGATEGISNAVNTMSGQVKETMGEISTATEEATEKQREALSIFKTASDTVNENVQAMTGLVKQLSGDITSGLNAVSDSRMKLGAAATSISEVANKLIEYIEAPRAH